MTENTKLPRELSEERKPPPPRRPSHADVIENLEGFSRRNHPKRSGPERLEAGCKRRRQGYARRRAKQAGRRVRE